MLTARTIEKLLGKWETENTTSDEKLIEAVKILGDMHRYCLKLERKIHNQRAANKENWEIVEMRRKWLGSDSARKMYANLLKRHQKLLQEIRGTHDNRM